MSKQQTNREFVRQLTLRKVRDTLTLERQVALKAKPVCWVIAGGEWVRVNQMHTAHLFNTLRMVWNHTVDPEFRILPFIRHPDPFLWKRSYKREIFHVLMKELLKREDLEPQQKVDLAEMGRA